MRIVVLSDTHVRTGRAGALPDAVYTALAGADAVLHAGDVVSADLLDELAAFAPVHAVVGNNDDEEVAARLGERLVLDLDGVTVAMVHDSGPTQGRPARLRRWFPEADLVVFGHSHAPVDELGVDGQRLFNPGSPTQRRRQPQPTFGHLQVRTGRIVHHRIEPVS